MNPRKKLIEVALPLEAINRESAREKSIRHGHPSTLHLWWARRPLAACRAVLFASLVDDPESDPEFDRRKLGADSAEHAIAGERSRLHAIIEELVRWENSSNETVLRAARAEIARCVASRKVEAGELKADEPLPGGETPRSLIRKGRTRVEPASAGTAKQDWLLHTDGLPNPEAVNAFLATHAPPVYDPFCGGGSIPLEAQRLGLRAFASDLNPVPVLITKALIEIPPKFAGLPPVNPEDNPAAHASRSQPSDPEARASRPRKSARGTTSLPGLQREWPGASGLAADVRYYGRWMRDEAERRIGHLYPKVSVTPEMAEGRPDLKPYVGQELTVIAWLWARTVASPNPIAESGHVPLVSSYMLSQKAGKKAWVDIVHDCTARDGWRFRVNAGEPTKEAETLAKAGSKAGKAKDFVCALTSLPIPRSYIQSEGKADRLGSRLMAIVADSPKGRVYLSPESDQDLVARSTDELPIVEDARDTFLSGSTPTRAMITGGVCSAYGFRTWGHLFTSRQLVTLITLSSMVAKAHERIRADAGNGGTASQEYANAIAVYLGLAVSKATVSSNSLARWRAKEGKSAPAFGRQAIPMVWDFAEVNPFAGAGGDFVGVIDGTVRTIANLPASPEGLAWQADAPSALGTRIRSTISTDPPYYNNISYAILSDFNYAWVRNSLRFVLPNLFSTLLTPKQDELIVSPHLFHGDESAAKEFFETGLRRTFERLQSSHDEGTPITIFYAFKQSETDEEDEEQPRGTESVSTASTGWETMLEGLIQSGLRTTGTWPMRTEMGTRMIGMGTNALASSIVLVCRSRDVHADTASRRDFLTALKRELPDALRALQHGNIAPVDLAQASIGPGMAVFSRYAKVVESDGSRMGVRTALQLINQALDEVLSEQEGEFDADTRWAIAWFEQFGHDEGAFGTADVLSRAKNTSVDGLKEAGLVASRAGKVRLLRRDELPADYDPAADARRPVWEVTQHLIRALDTHGEDAAAALLRAVGDQGEVARDLAYRLYTTCERKKWAADALAYNSLVIAWPQITRLAASPPDDAPQQGQMF